MLGITDTYSNYRLYKQEIVSKLNLRGGETFGAEFLVIAKKQGFKLGELHYEPPSRRKNPRIGGSVKANCRIMWASFKAFLVYLF